MTDSSNTSISNYTVNELKVILASELEALQNEISVEVETLSKTINRRICAEDNRNSSQNLGIVGAFVIAGLFSCVVISDLVGCILKSRQYLKKRLRLCNKKVGGIVKART